MIESVRPPERLTCTVPEAGALLGIGRDAAYRAASRGDIPVLRVGRRLLVPMVALRRMLGDTTPSVSPRPGSGPVSDVHPEPKSQAGGRRPCTVIPTAEPTYDSISAQVRDRQGTRRCEP